MIPNLIVPVLNRYDLLQRMLSSIDYPVRHLLIIDNGDGPNEQLQIPDRVKEITYSPMPNNLGVPGSWNLGIKCFPHNNRWFFSSADMVYEPGALEMLGQAMPTDLTLVAARPHWQTFVVGEQVVDKIGLFDEAFYPIYFEDNDYERRARHAGINVVHMEAPCGHDNSSTINSDEHLKRLNGSTFQENRNLLRQKERSNDYSVHGWTLSGRRRNSWD
jgi:GT2 family glycosyltransferase